MDAKILVKYGTLEGEATIRVWFPETPFRVELEDTRLSQVKGWKVTRKNSKARFPKSLLGNKLADFFTGKDRYGGTLPLTLLTLYNVSYFIRLNKRDSANVPLENEVIEDSHQQQQCVNRFQQTQVNYASDAIKGQVKESKIQLFSQVRVFARFIADDPNSGRKDFFPSRDSELDVTDLLLAGRSIRVEDPRVVSLRGTTVEGQTPGRTEIQVHAHSRHITVKWYP